MRLLRFLIGLAGLLVAVFAGGCSLLLVVETFTSQYNRQYADLEGLATVALIGGLPTVVGALLAWWGLRRTSP